MVSKELNEVVLVNLLNGKKKGMLRTYLGGKHLRGRVKLVCVENSVCNVLESPRIVQLTPTRTPCNLL